MEDKFKIIKEICLNIRSKNVYEIFVKIVKDKHISIHGPEHHIIDGACVLTAYYNAGGNINLEESLDLLYKEAIKMPGGMCGKWGVCGAVTSIGCALAIIDKTGPLSVNDWGEHMIITSKIVNEMSKIGGPRCCKRNGLLSLKNVTKFIRNNYKIDIKWTDNSCIFYEENLQCIKKRCPFYPKKRIAFICVHNSCRSQIAEALCKYYLGDVFESYSAGTEVKEKINQDAVRIMKELYGIDMELSQYSKLIFDIPKPDIVISMGCNVKCPIELGKVDYDFEIDDPSGKCDEEFIKAIKKIEKKVLELKKYNN